MTALDISSWQIAINNLEKGTTNYNNSTGTDAYSLTIPNLIAAPEAGQPVFFKSSTNNTGATATLNVQGHGAAPIFIVNGSGGLNIPPALSMLTGGIYFFIFDGTNWILLNPNVIVPYPPIFIPFVSLVGTINGTNTSFTIPGSSLYFHLQVFVNGLLNRFTTDYTVSGNTLTFVTAPATGSWAAASYVKY